MGQKTFVLFEQTRVRRAWMARLLRLSSEAGFAAAALELFRWQSGRCRPYRNLCRARGINPETLAEWRQIPAVPQVLFKETKIYCHRRKPRHVFETSGTTTGRRGRQYLLSDDIYAVVAVEGAIRAGLPADRVELQFLTPSPAAAPHSSLSRMFGYWKKKFGTVRDCFWIRHGVFHREALIDRLQRARRHKTPLGLCGTAFGFMPLLEGTPAGGFPLPSGSWILETGGFKGRSRELKKTVFYRELSRCFHVPDRRIWSEYGMTELGSQAYACGTGGAHRTPPWARVLVMDPEHDVEVRVGETGWVRWIDLANVDSVLAVQTQDRAIRLKDGFRLLGRVSQAEPRGCSLTAEEFEAA